MLRHPLKSWLFILLIYVKEDRSQFVFKFIVTLIYLMLLTITILVSLLRRKSLSVRLNIIIESQLIRAVLRNMRLAWEILKQIVFLLKLYCYSILYCVFLSKNGLYTLKSRPRHCCFGYEVIGQFSYLSKRYWLGYAIVDIRDVFPNEVSEGGQS